MFLSTTLYHFSLLHEQGRLSSRPGPADVAHYPSNQSKIDMETMSDERHYTTRLEDLSNARWKRILDVQAPYRWNVRRIVQGRLLDVGCGIGRNLGHFDGSGVGVDTNPHSVEVARRKGLNAYTADEFHSSPEAKLDGYDTLLFSHVLEHMSLSDASDLVAKYLPYVRPGGTVIIIVPQEAGFRSDPTHVSPVDLDELAHIETSTDLIRERSYSFPFPRIVGRFFRYNETVAISRVP